MSAERYKFRAECAHDVGVLLTHIGGDVDHLYMARELGNQGGWLPDVVVTFMSNLTLDDIRKVMRRVPDGHVMVETVALIGEYTGLRG